MSPGKSLQDIKLEDIDFDKVKECTDKAVLKRYIKLIEDDGSYFIDLLNACKQRLKEVAPKDYYVLYPRQASYQEVDEATKDLMDWELAVKETDAALLQSRKAAGDNLFVDASSKSRPIRDQEVAISRPNTFRKEERPKLADEPSKKDAVYARDRSNMKDYYRAWEQVDVDALEEDVDSQEKEAEEARRRHFEDMRDEQKHAQASSAISLENLPDKVPEAHRQHLADTEKEKGNEAFYAKDYEEAEAYYSRSIHFRPEDPSTWSNRALARLKREDPRGALEDCEHALALNPRYIKALHRKGKALHDLRRYEEAVKAFQLALLESPGNSQINGDLMVARRKMRSEESQPTTVRPMQNSGRSGVRIEELPDDAETSRTPSTASVPLAAGFTRVQIEEESDSEEGEPIAKAGPADRPGFRKVVIEEVSDSDGDGEAGEQPAATAATAATAPLQAGAMCFDDMD